MLPERILIEVGGREFRVSFGLGALAKFQKTLGLPDVPATMARLLTADADAEVALTALWAASVPIDGQEHYPSAQAMGEDIPLQNHMKMVEAIFRAVAAQMPSGREDPASGPLARAARPRKAAGPKVKRTKS